MKCDSCGKSSATIKCHIENSVVLLVCPTCYNRLEEAHNHNVAVVNYQEEYEEDAQRLMSDYHPRHPDEV